MSTTADQVTELVEALEIALSDQDAAVAGTLVPIVQFLTEAALELDRRLDLLELAVRGLIYEPVEEEEPVGTVGAATKTSLFGIPVEIVDGHTIDEVRAAVSSLPRGLDGKQVVDTLVDRGLLLREV